MSNPNGQQAYNMGHQQRDVPIGNNYATQARRPNEFMRPVHGQHQFMQNQPTGGGAPTISQHYHSQPNFNFYFEQGGTYDINLSGNLLPMQVPQTPPAFNSSPIPSRQPGGFMENRDASNLSSGFTSFNLNRFPPPPYQQQRGEGHPVVVPVPLHPGRMGQDVAGLGPSSAFAEYRVQSADDSIRSLLNQNHGFLDASNSGNDEERIPLAPKQMQCPNCSAHCEIPGPFDFK